VSINSLHKTSTFMLLVLIFAMFQLFAGWDWRTTTSLIVMMKMERRKRRRMMTKRKMKLQCWVSGEITYCPSFLTSIHYLANILHLMFL